MRGAGLHHVRLEAGPGELVIVRGPNGAGKSTFLSTVAGVRLPLAGRVLVEGRRASSTRARRSTGYVTDPIHLFEELTPGEHLALARSMWAAARVPTAGAEVSGALLDATPELPAGMLSLGQRKRVGLALAVLHLPPVWVLDEPFNGLDAASAVRLRAAIATHLVDGGVVLCATHDENALGQFDATVLEIVPKAQGALGSRASASITPASGSMTPSSSDDAARA